MSKRILITGGAGFIGKNLIKKLIQDTNVIIYVLDNFITSVKGDFDVFKKQYDIDNRVVLLNFDICDEKSMILVEYFRYDEIYHLASLASPIFYKKFPLETLDTGYLGTRNILEIARRQNCKVLFSSTSEIYGDAKVTPQDEEYYGNVNVFGCRSCYDESKRVAEALCLTYIQKYDLDVKIARIFNTYGPFMTIDDGRILTECIKHLINGTTLTIFGDGNQSRSCCFIDDTVDMLISLMKSNCTTPVNIGNDVEISVNEIVKIAEQVYETKFNKQVKLNKLYLPLTQNDPLQRKPCLKKNKLLLGERSYIGLEEGITQMIAFYV